MRILRILAFLSFAVVLHAQSRGKVAIIAPGQSSLISLITADVIEPIVADTISTVLPTDLNQYDALFIKPWDPSDMLDSAMQAELVNYIDSGGKLYVEGSENVIDSTDTSNPFWLRVGVKGNTYTALEFSVNSVHGTQGFTQNIWDSLPLDLYQSGYGGPGGNITPVLVADGGGWMIQQLAYISEDTSLRVVVYDGIGEESYPGTYYSAFITDVVCNYFNLCSADVNTAPPAISTENISIVHDSRDNGYSVSGDFTTGGEVSVFNSLGINIWSTNIQAGENLVGLPATLRNGFYFVSVRSGDNINAARFSILN
jgi:hypothetical protein